MRLELLATALPAALLAPAMDAILFDMDGVLADVSLSQHRAIIDTAAHFGVKITKDDIVRIKMAGNANNDWDVTTSTRAGPTEKEEKKKWVV